MALTETTDVVPTSESADLTSASGSGPQGPQRILKRRAAGRLVYWIIFSALLAFNGWIFAGRLAPEPDLKPSGVLLRQDRLEEAEAEARKYLKVRPYDGSALLLLGRILIRQEKYAEAAEVLHQVPHWWPAKRQAEYFEGEAALQANLVRDAERAMRAAIVHDPLHLAPDQVYIDGVEKLLTIYATEERWDEALELAWDTYDRVVPEQKPKIRFIVLRTRMERIAAEQRLKDLNRYLNANPDDPIARLGLAIAHQDAGDGEAALEQIQIVLEEDPENLRAWQTYLKLLKEVVGDYEAMARAIEQLPASSDQDPILLLYHGQVLQQQAILGASGDAQSKLLKESVSLLKKSLELDPYQEEAFYALSRSERSLGNIAASDRALARSKELREARNEQLLQAYFDYMEVMQASLPDPDDLEQTRTKLGSIFRKLGWDRLAEIL